MGQAEVGRIFGIPIVIDGTFLLLALLFGFNHFTSGSTAGISYGVVLVTGVALSILLHELGHAAAARFYGVGTAAIELNGLGGLCHFARPLPLDRITNIVVLLAGPAANLFLWYFFAFAATAAIDNGVDGPVDINRTAMLLLQLSEINQMLLVFNLLPAHPLYGGRALAQILSLGITYGRAMRVCAVFGFVIAAMLALSAITSGIFIALMAWVIFQANLEVWKAYQGNGWRRW